ncbi:MAG: peptidoglycan DD-metalloendopeptidase family protein [Oscillospiraceae bacterium]|nr:peptidoglycan DD-metalloendopeptidase family protein [Oscillospiraceae bacterium]
MAELEAGKQNLAANRKELEETLNETKSLLAQLQLMNADMETLLEQAKEQDADMAARIEAFMSAYADAEEQNQQRWIVPLQYTVCTSPFGDREHPVPGEIATYHHGVDLAAPQGTPVVASRSGTVTVATYEEHSGNYVIVDHLDGYTSRYLHLQKFIVSEGQFVMAGQIIGYCGSTGVSTGPHLHFGIYHNGKAVDPADYISM